LDVVGEAELVTVGVVSAGGGVEGKDVAMAAGGEVSGAVSQNHGGKKSHSCPVRVDPETVAIHVI